MSKYMLFSEVLLEITNLTYLSGFAKGGVPHPKIMINRCHRKSSLGGCGPFLGKLGAWIFPSVISIGHK